MKHRRIIFEEHCQWNNFEFTLIISNTVYKHTKKSSMIESVVSLHTTSFCRSSGSWLRNALDVVSQDLSVWFTSSLSKIIFCFASFKLCLASCFGVTWSYTCFLILLVTRSQNKLSKSRGMKPFDADWYLSFHASASAKFKDTIEEDAIHRNHYTTVKLR